VSCPHGFYLGWSDRGSSSWEMLLLRASIRRTLPTMHHALQLFEVVVEQLAEPARLDPTSTRARW